MTRRYDKRWFSYEQQVQKLIERGLAVRDKAAAQRFLAHLNYYRFSGYCLAFEAEWHVFREGTTFEDVAAAYEFDRSLRDLLTEALETIEVDLRTAVAYHFGEKYGAFGHTAPASFFHEDRHGEWLKRLRDEADRSKELFVTHFRRNYEEFPDLPIWIVTEVMSFGSLSKMYRCMQRQDQRKIARCYGVQPADLENWMHHCVYVRNLCAHHSRLWDRKWSIRPAILAGNSWQPPLLPDNMRLFATLLVVRHLLKRMPAVASFAARWARRVEVHLDDPPSVPKPLEPMGLTSVWKAHPVWK